MRADEPLASAPSATRRIAVVGATGRTGRAVVDEALRRGLEVRGLSRVRGRVARGAVEVVGDALVDRSVRELLAGTTAAICVIGPDPDGPTDACSRATATLVSVAASSASADSWSRRAR